MDTKQTSLMNEILLVTSRIQDELPGVYRLLNETPLYLTQNEQEISNDDFTHYLESLKMQWNAFRMPALIG